MKIVIFVMMAFAQSALCAELLMPNHLFYTSEQSDEFAFESSDKNGILQNPPSNKARIYGAQSAVILGLHKARANLKLIDKASCERIYKEIN